MNAFQMMWESQLIVMMFWSLACFALGAVFTATLYWYRVNYVVKRANRELELMAHPMNRRQQYRRFTDIYRLPPPLYTGEERRKER